MKYTQAFKDKKILRNFSGLSADSIILQFAI